MNRTRPAPDLNPASPLWEWVVLCCLIWAHPVLAHVLQGVPDRQAIAILPRLQIGFSVESGFFEKPFPVLLTSTGGSSIRYTTDGREPSLTVGSYYANPLPITNTAIIRAAAFSADSRISPVATHSYLFAEQVLRQPANPRGFPVGPQAWNGHASNYAMDARVIDDPDYRDRLIPAFRALPILSLVGSAADLFGPTRGIYVNSQQRGQPWERACSVELILPTGASGFQIDCGVRIQGNYNRIPEKSPKHSFRLLFKSTYGPSKLHYQMFPDSSVSKFDTLVLRADYNNSWIHWDAHSSVRGQRIRDAWMKDSQRAMGWISPHSRYVHLFLNGLYWGLYDVTERPDANFAAAYLGGAREDYDVINEFEVKDGIGAGFQALHAAHGLGRSAQYEKLRSQLHITEYIDYLLLNYYGGNRDWGENKNWYALRRREPAGPFQYIAWDGEQIFQNQREDIVSHPYEVPFRMAGELRENAEFRLAFADRVQKHCFGEGALTPGAVAARWMARAKEIDLAIIAESARWGGFRKSPPYNRDRDWMAEQSRLLKNYFPVRTDILVAQLRAVGLYPAIPAPVVTISGSGADAQRVLTFTSPGQTIYCTTNGTDPRVYGTGLPSPDALSYPEPVAFRGAVTVSLRGLKDGVWSALVKERIER